MIIDPHQFEDRLRDMEDRAPMHRAVTGPGRRGAIAAAFWSHLTGVPFIPYGQPCPEKLRPILVIDTALNTGKTLRKASRRYNDAPMLWLWNEPPRVKFWYEETSPC